MNLNKNEKWKLYIWMKSNIHPNCWKNTNEGTLGGFKQFAIEDSSKKVVL